MTVADGFHVDTIGNLWLGSDRRTFDSTTQSEAKFYVEADGTMVAKAGATFAGDLSAAGGTFSGNLSAAGGTFSGNLSAAGGTFTGTLSGVDGTFTGTISASNVTGGTLNFDNVTASNLDFSSLSVQAGDIVAQIATDEILGKISNGAISDAKLGNINASKITAGTMSADRISGGTIDASLITSGTLSLGPMTVDATGMVLTGSVSILPANSNSTIGNGNNTLAGSTLNITSSGSFGSSVSASNGLFSGYVTGDEFRGNNSTVDIHRNGTSNGIRIVGASSGAYVFTYNSSGSSHTLYNPFSDERLKENISDLDYGLDEILQLRPITYDWKDDVRPFPENTELQYGLLAQEVEEVMPDIVDTAPSTHTVLDEEGNETEEDLGVMVDGTLIQNTKSYDERPLTYALIKAVQELSAKNDELESRIAALEG